MITFETTHSLTIKETIYFTTLALRTYYTPSDWDRVLTLWSDNAGKSPRAEYSLEREIADFLRDYGTKELPRKICRRLLDPTQAADLKYCVYLNFTELDLYEMKAQEIYNLIDDYLNPNVAAPDREVLEFAVQQLNKCELRPEYQGLYEDRLFELNRKITKAEDDLIEEEFEAS
ncbi:hypothetical protein U2F10_02865 [Leptothoe sp. EHU-05/26/07-4]